MKLLIKACLAFFGIALAMFSWIHFLNKLEINENTVKHIGLYKIDLRKTDLGVYKADSIKYANLKVSFSSDNIFKFNMNPPFIYDSIGTWVPPGRDIDAWGVMNYNSDNNISTHFTNCCIEGGIIYMNSVTPKRNNEGVNIIYFKKIK